MGKPTGFIEYARRERVGLPVRARTRNFDEFMQALPESELRTQGARCMDCGIPYCHSGCPVHNLIPEWNELVHRNDWRRAADALHATNNFPEFTGRICPAPCESACTLYLHDAPVTIKTIEHAIIERAFAENWVRPQLARTRTDKRIAIVGSGPAGLACAQQLARAGHAVAVYEKHDRSGGLLRYGIPDFKLDKRIIDRRMAQMKAEGVVFHNDVDVGVDLPSAQLVDEFDAIVLAGGADQPRDLTIAGRELHGVHFAMDYLTANSRCVQDSAQGRAQEHAQSHAHDALDNQPPISARDKRVVVIGGGDTGSDCIGTANRQAAASVTQIEILSRPPQDEDKTLTWPNWPHKLRTSSSHEEGCQRLWDVATRAFIDDGAGRLAAVRCVKVAWRREAQQWRMHEVPDSQFDIPAELALLAMGFLHATPARLLDELAIRFDSRGNVKADENGAQAHRTHNPKVFVAGDMRRGQSLVVWAIREGRRCARAVDCYLRGVGFEE